MKNIIIAISLLFSVAFAQQRTVRAFYDLIAEHPDVLEMTCNSFENLREGTTCHVVQVSTFDAYLIIQEARDTFNLFAFRNQGWGIRMLNEGSRLHTNTYFDGNDYLSVAFFQATDEAAIVFLEVGTLEED